MLSIFFFFFFTPIDNFCHHVKTPAARGSAVFHSMDNRWQGRTEMAAWKKSRKKKRLTHWDSHWDPAEHSTQSPNESDRGSVCLSVCIYVWWVVSLRVLVKAVCMLWCVWWGKLSSAGWTTQTYTLVFAEWLVGEVLCFSCFNKCLMDSPHCVAAVHRWPTLIAGF